MQKFSFEAFSKALDKKKLDALAQIYYILNDLALGVAGDDEIVSAVQTHKCQGKLKNGQPCTNNKKDGTLTCGMRAHIAQFYKVEKNGVGKHVAGEPLTAVAPAQAPTMRQLAHKAAAPMPPSARAAQPVVLVADDKQAMSETESDSDTDAAIISAATAAAPAPASKAKSKRCLGVNATGKQCAKFTLNSSQLCHIHDH